MKKSILTIAILISGLTLSAQSYTTLHESKIGGWGSDATLKQTVDETGDTITFIKFADWQYGYITVSEGFIFIEDVSVFISQLVIAQSKASSPVTYIDKDSQLLTKEENSYVFLTEGSKYGYLAKGQVKKLIKKLNKLK